MNNRTGAVITTVRLRAGPSPEAPAADVLMPNTTLEIVKREGDWWEVKATDKHGYVHQQFILLDDEKEILTRLEQQGPVSPSRLAAERRLAPGEAWETLQHLAVLGRVTIVDDATSPDGKLAMLVDTSVQMKRAKK